MSFMVTMSSSKITSGAACFSDSGESFSAKRFTVISTDGSEVLEKDSDRVAIR